MEKNQSDQLIGVVLGGRFRVVRLIGQGGMANVYLATDLQNQARVAVKVLKSEFLSDEEFVRRFDIEAKAASSLHHPNIVKVYGVGEENHIRYMVMQYVEGMTLKEMIDQYGSLDWRVAVPICIQIARALQHAHEHGIVHRDIKPHNIMITRDHRALVTDFGIARASTANTITLSGGSAMGSVHYFSPEQARGGIVGAKGDIYSLGILMYELVTGKLPFDGETSVSVAIMHLQEEAPPPIQILPQLPRGLNDIILKCIRKNPGERYASARDLENELLAFQRHPEGHYGHVQVQAGADASRTTVMPALYSEGNGFLKVRDLERSIQERRKRRRRETIIVTLVILLTLALIGFFFAWVFRGLQHKIGSVDVTATGVELGTYVNRPYEEVDRELNQLKIPHQTKQAFSDEIAAGHVMEQNLPPGRVIKQLNLSELVLTVSKGSDEFTLADYTGKSAIEVENQLRSEHNLVVQVEYEANEKVEQGLILKTDPAAGTSLRPGYTIKLVISSGPRRSVVPDLKDLRLDEAKDMILSAGLTIGPVEGEDPDYDEKDLVVSSQNPAAGEQVAPDSEVSLHLKPKPEATKKPRHEPMDGPLDPLSPFPFHFGEPDRKMP